MQCAVRPSATKWGCDRTVFTLLKKAAFHHKNTANYLLNHNNVMLLICYSTKHSSMEFPNSNLHEYKPPWSP